MTRKLLLNNGLNLQEDGLKAYYSFVNHDPHNSDIVDLSPNKNDAYVTGSYSWTSDSLQLRLTYGGGGGQIYTPLHPTESNKDFKIEMFIKSLTTVSHPFGILCNTQPLNVYDTGLYCSTTLSSDNPSNNRMAFEFSGCIIKYPIGSSVYNMKVVIEKRGTSFSVKVNDSSLGTQHQTNSKLSNEQLIFGPAELELTYIKYYEF